MTLNNEIQLFLEQVWPKAAGARMDIQEASRLNALFIEYPCNLEVALLMITAASNAQARGRTDLGFSGWTIYADEALDRIDCWNEDDLSQLHLRIATHYYVGNDDEMLTIKAREHMRKAYELAPLKWEVIDQYIFIVHPPLDEIPLLAEQMLCFGGNDKLMVVYKYTTHLDSLLHYGRTELRDKVIWGIKQLFNLGLGNTSMRPDLWRKRLEELETFE